MDTARIQVQYACTDGGRGCVGTAVAWVDWSDPVDFTDKVKKASPSGWRRLPDGAHVCGTCHLRADLERNGTNSVGTR
jgi:hypothetical protein